MLISQGAVAIVMLWLDTCGGIEKVFLVQFMDFKMPISSSQMLEINRWKPTRGFSLSESKSYICHCPFGSVWSQQNEKYQFIE